jgi:starch synthase
MYGLRYGTVPIVRRVGGLADTVRDVGHRDSAAAPGNGFVFDAAQPPALQGAIARAFDLYRKRQAWVELMQQGMGENLSWEGPAKLYMALYGNVVSEHGDARRKELD